MWRRSRSSSAPPSATPLLGRRGVACLPCSRRLEQAKAELAARRARAGPRPERRGGLVNKGTALSNLGRFEEALAACDRALALDPNDASWNNKGNALNDLGRYEEALAAYDRALALDPNVAMAWNNKGGALNA